MSSTRFVSVSLIRPLLATEMSGLMLLANPTGDVKAVGDAAQECDAAVGLGRDAACLRAPRANPSRR